MRNNFMRKFFILFCVISCTLSLNSQTLKISGNVQDTAAKIPLENALGMVIRLNDSTLVKFARTDKGGLFKLDALPIDTYIVIISHPQFADQTFIVVGSDKQKEFDFGKIILPPKTNTLNEVMIYAYRDKVYYKGDTLIFTADSFKTRQNATVEDLLKKLPGVRVDAKGKITVQGKTVDQVLVDGDEFFGSDPTIATKNLAANTVETVQVYEKKNENTDSKDETVKVMNLKLKDEAKKGYFGKISGAGGTDALNTKNFYEGELLANSFKKNRKISLFGLGANSPRQAFGWNDVFQYGLNNEYSFESQDGDPNSGTWSMGGGQANGIPQTLKTGFYYNDKLSKKTKINTDYTYNNNLLNTLGTTNTQYFLGDTTYTDAQTKTGRQTNQSHGLNLRINQTLDSLTELIFAPKIKYSTNTTSDNTTDDFYSEDKKLTRQTVVTNTNDNTVTDVTGNLKLNRKFKKKDRFLYLSYNINVRNEENLGYLNSTNHYFLPVDSVHLVNQQKTNNNSKQEHQAVIIYTEPITPKIKLEFSYDFLFNKSLQDKTTKDFSGTAYDIENPTLTNNFNNTRQIQRGGLRFIYEVKKYRISLGSRYRQVQQSSLNLSSGKTLSQTVNNVLPYAGLRYRFSDNKNLSVDYSTSSQQPDLNQMQPVIDNTNPNRITIGNPSLKPTYGQSLNFNFYSFKPISNRNVYGGGNFSSTNNAITYTTVYDKSGIATSQPVNVNGNYNANGYLGLQIPVLKQAIKIDPNLNASFSNNVNYINGLLNITKQQSYSGGGNIGHDGDKLTVYVGSTFSYNKPSSTISSQSSQPYNSLQVNGEVSYKFPKKFGVRTDATYTNNSKRTNGYNISYFIWNAEINKSFFKAENLILSINAYDILNQNISTKRTVLDNRIVDSKNQIIKQYFLLKLMWKFNSNKGKQEENEF